MVSETRYMRSDLVLGLVDTDTNPTPSVFGDNTSKEYWGIRVWIKHLVGVDTEVLGLAGIASAVNFVVAGVALTATVSAGFTVAGAGYAMLSTDEIKVEVYMDVSNPPTALAATFITSGLNASHLDAGNWTVFYRYHRNAKVGATSQFYFYYGHWSVSDDSYITTFQYTPVAGGAVLRRLLVGVGL